MDHGARVIPGLVYDAVSPRPETDLSDLGHSYARRALGLPIADRSQHRMTLLKELF
jgi:hypothetical protein